MIASGNHTIKKGNPSVSFADSLGAARPVAALTADRAVIHYRDCASLTLYTREPWALPRQLDKLEFSK